MISPRGSLYFRKSILIQNSLVPQIYRSTSVPSTSSENVLTSCTKTLEQSVGSRIYLFVKHHYLYEQPLHFFRCIPNSFLCKSFGFWNPMLFPNIIKSDVHSFRIFVFLQVPSYDQQKNPPISYLGQSLLEQNTACSVSKKNKKPITIS